MTLIVRVTEEEEEEEEEGSAGSAEKLPPLPTLGAPSPPPLTRTYFPPPYSQTHKAPAAITTAVVSTFSIVALLWMQHICCMVAGHPCTILSPLKPTQALHKHHGPKTNRPLDWEDEHGAGTTTVLWERATRDAHANRTNDQLITIYCQPSHPLWLHVLRLHSSVCSAVCRFPYGHTSHCPFGVIMLCTV